MISLPFHSIFHPFFTASPLVDKMIAGQNGLLFAYGITNSGKTYTIQGAPENEGIVPRMLMDLFGRLERQQAGDGTPYHVLVTAHAQALVL
jgi:hypothetical protein